jgi:hypothetical protein
MNSFVDTVLEVFSDEVTRDDIFRVLPAVIIHVHVI